VGTEIEPVGDKIADAGDKISDAVTYLILLACLTAAGVRLMWLSAQVRQTYAYVEGCAAGVDRLAEQMAGLDVDDSTVGEHHEAAAVMRSVLADAEAMAAGTEDLAALFHQTRDAHQNDYGTVADAAHAMPVPMAQSEFYSNR
jgi:cell division protein FtsL